MIALHPDYVGTWHLHHDTATELPYSISLDIKRQVLDMPEDGYRAVISVQVLRPGRGPPSPERLEQARAAAEHQAIMLAWHLTPVLEEAFSLPRTRERYYTPIAFQTVRYCNARAGWRSSSGDPRETRHPEHFCFCSFGSPPGPPAIALAELAAQLPPVFGNRVSLHPAGGFYQLTLVDHSADCLARLPSEEQVAVRRWYAANTEDSPAGLPPLPEGLTPTEEVALQHLRELAVEYAKQPLGLPNRT
jgi:hypothetical protein